MTKRTALSHLYHDMYTTGGPSSTRLTESPLQAQQGFAEPTLDTYVQLQASRESLNLAHTPYSPRTQRKKVAESGSPQQHKDSAEGFS